MHKRPHLEYFLSELIKIADVHLFTASKKEYAEQILSVLDPTKLIFKKRLFREVYDSTFNLFVGL